MMTNRLHRFILFLGIICGMFLPSCNDENDSTGGNLFLRFKANGTQVAYTNQATLTASFSSTGSINLCVITGYTATSNVSLQAYDTVAVSEGTYTGYDIASSAGILGALIGYQTDNGVLYTQGTGASHDAAITITEITATHVRGTFQGNVKASGQTDIRITEGEFFVQRLN